MLNGKVDEISNLETTEWNDENYRKWLHDKGHVNIAAELAYDVGNYEEAFARWESIAHNKVGSADFDYNLCFDRLKQ